MAKIYAELIRKGLKTIDEVPKKSGQKFKQSLMQMLNLFLFLFGKVVKDMAVIYATLIVKGVKKFLFQKFHEIIIDKLVIIFHRVA